MSWYYPSPIDLITCLHSLRLWLWPIVSQNTSVNFQTYILLITFARFTHVLTFWWESIPKWSDLYFISGVSPKWTCYDIILTLWRSKIQMLPHSINVQTHLCHFMQFIVISHFPHQLVILAWLKGPLNCEIQHPANRGNSTACRGSNMSCLHCWCQTQ